MRLFFVLKFPMFSGSLHCTVNKALGFDSAILSLLSPLICTAKGLDHFQPCQRERNFYEMSAITLFAGTGMKFNDFPCFPFFAAILRRKHRH